MNKHEKIVLQCADCEFKYKKTLKWLENTHSFVCSHCNVELDIDEVINEIMSSEVPQDVYTIYQK
jgi:peptide subunit release factor 1 (eRF1)